MQSNSFQILLVEDSPGDAYFIRVGLEESGTPCSLTVMADGDEAIEFLYRQLDRGAPLPDLVVLDLHLPRRDGHEVLAGMRSDPGLRSVPVVMFSGTGEPSDIRKAYELGANCFVAKPLDSVDFMRVIGEIARFWFTLVSPPHQHRTLSFQPA